MAKKKADPVIHATRDRKLLPCKLTQEEIVACSKEQSQNIQTVVEIKNQLKAIQSEMGGRVKQLEAGIGVLANRIKNGEEMRSVDVEVQANYTDCTITVVRLDTGQPIESRNMTGEEKQLQIDFEDDQDGGSGATE